MNELMQEKKINKNWFVLYTHSRCEFKVLESLEALGIITYLPIKKSIKMWSDRKKEIASPLFPGYVFILANEKERLISIENKQVARCLTDAGKPAIVPDWQMESLQKIIKLNSPPDIIEGLVEGNMVEITSGPLKGIQGVIADNDNKNRLTVSIELIHRTVIVHLLDDWVRVIK
jgi:transcriptional antiterminator RfaH